MSKDYNHEIGYEALRKDFEVYKRQAPRGVTLVKESNNIYLQFKTPNKSRSKYRCNCTFSIDGMIDAVRKASKVKEKLESLTSEVEFWDWYDKEIKQESQLVDDRLTFGEAIAKVEDGFWSSLSRTKQPRDKENPSDINSYRETYGKFYDRLPASKLLAFDIILSVVNEWEEGTTTYGYAISAMKKLARVNAKYVILERLNTLNVAQTKFLVLQSVDLEDFLSWRDKVLGVTKTLHKNSNIDSRKAWLWAFSVQIVYGLRISEVFAIANLTQPHTTKDGVAIPALNDPDNTNNLIYIGEKTVLGTKVKTGARIARPQIPPKYPDLIERLDIKNPIVPTGKPKSSKPETLVKFYAKEARTRLVRWNAPFTQTHADRNLGNINGIQAGIPQEVRAQSMGHTVQMNESVYKKRQSTQTTIDLLLNSNQNAIDFVTALSETKRLIKSHPEYKKPFAKLLSIIYQKNVDEIHELL